MGSDGLNNGRVAECSLTYPIACNQDSISHYKAAFENVLNNGDRFSESIDYTRIKPPSDQAVDAWSLRNGCQQNLPFDSELVSGDGDGQKWAYAT